MTVRPGADWGTGATRPSSPVVVRSDAALAAALGAGGEPVPLLRGGDLHRTLGAPAGSNEARRLAIDLLHVRTDDAELTAAAHVVARRGGRLGWWRGPLVAVMNAEFLGAWDVAPRAHPNDGRMDVIEVDPSMTLRDRWQAHRRLPSGTHLPHPCVRVRVTTSVELTFPRRLSIWVDGVPCGRSRRLHVDVLADAAAILT